jgi:hypothetical protein
MPASYHKGPFEVVAVAAANEATRQQMLSLGSGVRVSHRSCRAAWVAGSPELGRYAAPCHTG